MNPFISRTFALLLAVTVSTLHGQVPQLINYQGRVAVGNPPLNFDGTGLFKFALVNATGTTSFWSNDGTSVGGGEPAGTVSLPVTKGLYSVLLGANMQAVPNSVFNNTEVSLRVWFNDGLHGFQHLEPDQRIAAVGFAMMAGNVPDGAITSAKIAAGAVGSTQLAAGAVTANLNAAGQSGVASGGLVLSAAENPALVSAGYQRFGTVTTPEGWIERNTNPAPPAVRESATSVWTGNEMIVWGGYTGGVYLNTGGRFHLGNNTWTALPTTGAPSPRIDHTAIWTGSEMIIWGGFNGTNLNDGMRYNPQGNTWTAMNTIGAPTARSSHVAVWTGSEMIIWGGYNSIGLPAPDTGARYNPVTDSWTPMSTASAPAGRGAAQAVWTGSEMVVWGGELVNTGGRYNPTSDTWAATNTVNAPVARVWHTTVWTGNRMIVWGGWNFGTHYNDGGLYDPVGNTWTAISMSSAPTARKDHTAVWTGSEMIVWGGWGSGSTSFNTGARYSPAANTWNPTLVTGAPSARYSHTACWSGSDMIIWGGVGSSTTNACIYTPARVLTLYQRP